VPIIVEKSYKALGSLACRFTPRTSDLDKVVIGIRKGNAWKVIFFTLFEVDVPAIS